MFRRSGCFLSVAFILAVLSAGWASWHAHMNRYITLNCTAPLKSYQNNKSPLIFSGQTTLVLDKDRTGYIRSEGLIYPESEKVPFFRFIFFDYKKIRHKTKTELILDNIRIVKGENDRATTKETGALKNAFSQGVKRMRLIITPISEGSYLIGSVKSPNFICLEN